MRGSDGLVRSTTGAMGKAGRGGDGMYGVSGNRVGGGMGMGGSMGIGGSMGGMAREGPMGAGMDDRGPLGMYMGGNGLGSNNMRGGRQEEEGRCLIL